MKKLLCAVLAALLLAGCGSDGGQTLATDGQDAGTPTETTVEAPTVDTEQADEEMFTDRDLDAAYDEDTAVVITLSGTTATATSDSVRISGSTVQLTQEATYIISGTLDDGMLIVNAPDTAKLQLVLDGAAITSSTGAALYVLEADKVFVTLAEGSENTLANGGSFTAIDGENIDAALYSKQDVTVNGTGSLTVTSPAGHGITAKDDLVITGGQLKIDAAGHALDANDSVRFSAASLTATAGKDGIHCENSDDASLGYVYISGGSMDLEAQGDGISAGATVHILGGSIDILAGGGYENGSASQSSGYGGFMGGHGGMGRPGGRSTTVTTSGDDATSMKGIKSEGLLRIDGGTFHIDSADDALHSNSSMTICGGTYTIASGDDALHAEETLTFSGGTVNISASYEGLEALHIAVTGGDIRLVASDDGLNAAGGTDSSGTGGRDHMFGGMGGHGGMMSGSSNGSITISGGTLYINASGDGIDANGTLEISGGHVTVVGPTQGDTATLDYDLSATITGGTFIGTGASNMAQSFSDAEQGIIALSVGSQAAGTEITVTDDSGNTLLSYAPELSYQVLIISMPELQPGESYTVTVGTQSGTFEA